MKIASQNRCHLNEALFLRYAAPLFVPCAVPLVAFRLCPLQVALVLAAQIVIARESEFGVGVWGLARAYTQAREASSARSNGQLRTRITVAQPHHEEGPLTVTHASACVTVKGEGP
jgi:hypothetical protein